MEFDYSYDPANDPKLSAATAELMRSTRTHWRNLGLSVQFVSNATGTLTEWSFRSVAQREPFIAKNLVDKPYVISEERIPI